ncbi:2,3,4,5-tetrahydropyridine-2,6-dicarboxylate N-succinyltransferase, partial [Neisseria sp. P0006.S006]
MSLQNIIETAFENRAEINPNTVTPEVREAVLETIRQLDSGKLRVAERLGVGEWKVNEWAKKAVLLSFRIQDNEILNDGVNKYFDKVPTKFADWSEDEFR